MRIFVVVLFSACALPILAGCISDSEAEAVDEFTDLSFAIVSESTQSDIRNQRLEAITNVSEFSQLISSAPSMKGALTNPDFSSTTLSAVFPGFSPCTDIEASSVQENADTAAINLTKVITVFPGLCDPSPQGLSNKDYALISTDRITKPISFLFKKRNDYRPPQKPELDHRKTNIGGICDHTPISCA